MLVPESYRGREQSFVKHHLLKTYMERLFMIIGLHQRVVRYVDCFSGPWQQGAADLQDTSIGIALSIISKCQDGLKALRKNVEFHALFIEKKKAPFRELQSFLSDFPNQTISTKALNGDFFDLRDSILDWCGPADFTFFFIDPKGWKKVVEIPTLTPLLRRPNSEFLINFMYDFLLRTHTQASFREEMQAIFGEVPDTRTLSPEKKNKYLLDLYRHHLKEISPARGGKPRTFAVPVLYPMIDRSVYHLVYLTRHAKGMSVFAEESEKLDFLQRRTRADVKQADRVSRDGQLEMFRASSLVAKENRVDPAEVTSYWLKKLSTSPSMFGLEELADMLEETGWFESDLQTTFGELEKEGLVKNLDGSGKRRKKFVHFTENNNRGERLVRVIL